MTLMAEDVEPLQSLFFSTPLLPATGPVLAFAFLIGWFTSVVSAVFLILSFYLGAVACHSLLRLDTETNPFLFPSRSVQIDKPREVRNVACSTCDSKECRRHRADLNLLALQPWTNIRIPSSVDKDLETFLTKTLDEYVYAWYGDLTKDECFVHELRIGLKYMIAVILRKLYKVDLATFILDKVLKRISEHVDCYLRGRKMTYKDVTIEQATFDYYGSKQHRALKNKDSEVRYLKELSELLMPLVIPKRYRQSKPMVALLRELLSEKILMPVVEILAEPDNVNFILCLLLDKDPMVEYPQTKLDETKLLDNFTVGFPSQRKSKLTMELQYIRKTPERLYSFMQFLKREGAVNLLQFITTVEEFQLKLLNPELSVNEMENLRREAQKMYQTYFLSGAYDCIAFPQYIVEGFRNIAFGPLEGVVRFHTTPPLLKAFDYVYELLDRTFCPLFHQSDEYFGLISGRGTNDYAQKLLPKNQKKEGKMAKIGSKIQKLKGAFNAATIDGHALTDTLDLCEPVFSEDLDIASNSAGSRDLSKWHVSIPLVDKPNPDSYGKDGYCFFIEVDRCDIDLEVREPRNWIVPRRYNEFYLLEEKLTEFHGIFADCRLPPKRIIFGVKDLNFMKARRPIFEEWLQKLLQKHSLKRSELLYTFLTLGDFGPGLSVELNLGKLIRTQTRKLIRERGQHLETFLKNFYTSVEAAKPKPGKLQWSSDIEDYIPPPAAESPPRVRRSSFEVRTSNVMEVNGVYDVLVILCIRVFETPLWILQLLCGLRSLLRCPIDRFLDWYLHGKLKKALVPQRISLLIELLHETLYETASAPRTDQEKTERSEEALRMLRAFIPEFVGRVMGWDHYMDGTKLLFSAFQQPKLNKQLVFVLLDEVVLELFPEIISEESPGPMTP